MNLRKILPLLLIILIGAFLRLIDISNNPPALYGDELTMTYDAYSLLKTGHDQTGAFLPLTFSMGAGRPAGYVYFSIPFVTLFGPTALGIRFLSFLSGVGIIILIYKLGRLTISPKVGLIAAALMAISPWDISLSRGGFEAHLALFLALLGTVLFLLAKEKNILYFFAAIAFGLVLHTYPTYKLTLPLFFILLIWYQGGLKVILKSSKTAIAASVAVFAIFVLGAVTQTFTGGSETRFWSINVFSVSDLKENIIQRVNIDRNINQLPHFISAGFHNQPIEYTLILSESYLKNFSLDFLFLHGDKNPRHNMATMGSFYAIESLLMLLGLRKLWKNYSRKIFILIIGWILITPLATAFLLETHALRNAFMLPPMLLLSSLGILSLGSDYHFKHLKLFQITAGVLFLVQFLFLIEILFFLAPNKYSSFWAYPAKLAVETALKNKQNYKYIILSSRIDNVEFAYPVYAQVDPKQAIGENLNKSSLNNQQFKKFDNIYIGSLPVKGAQEFINSLDGSVLYIGSIFEKDEFGKFNNILGKDNIPAFLTYQK